jgi:hypothetical protein
MFVIEVTEFRDPSVFPDAAPLKGYWRGGSRVDQFELADQFISLQVAKDAITAGHNFVNPFILNTESLVIQEFDNNGSPVGLPYHFPNYIPAKP